LPPHQHFCHIPPPAAQTILQDITPPTSIFATHHLLQHKQYFRMSAVTLATVAVAKKRKVKGLPPGLEKLTETCEFWKSLKFQLEMDGKEPGKHMVAYKAYFEDFPSVQLDSLLWTNFACFAVMLGVTMSISPSIVLRRWNLIRSGRVQNESYNIWR
jgi:hypothetical protein